MFPSEWDIPGHSHKNYVTLITVAALNSYTAEIDIKSYKERTQKYLYCENSTK